MEHRTYKYLNDRLQLSIREKQMRADRLSDRLEFPWEKILRKQVRQFEARLRKARRMRQGKAQVIKNRISKAASLVRERIILNDADGALLALKRFERKAF